MTENSKKPEGSRPFDPEDMKERISRLNREGKMPSLRQFLDAMKKALEETRAHGFR